MSIPGGKNNNLSICRELSSSKSYTDKGLTIYAPQIKYTLLQRACRATDNWRNALEYVENTYITYLYICITVLKDYHGKEIGTYIHTGTKKNPQRPNRRV